MKRQHLSGFMLGGAILAAAIIQTGCYKRVVRAEGPGTESIDVYEPNLTDKQLERFGSSSTSSKRTVESKTVPTKTAR